MGSSEFRIRPATLEDIPVIFDLIKALAEYEQLAHQVTGNEDSLRAHLFGESPCVEAILAETESVVVGFALFFGNYSTFLTKPGIYLEDLFVLSDYRGQGIGTAMLQYLGNLAKARNSGRLEWSVLDWKKCHRFLSKNEGRDITRLENLSRDRNSSSESSPKLA